MKKDSARIAVILDRSGSMEAVRDATIDGFNEFIRGQREDSSECSVKLVQFDDQYEEVFDKELKDVPKLTRETFIPRGNTALFDAIGRTINSLGSSLDAAPEDQRPERVIVVVLTDGMENASQEFTQPKIAEMVKHQQDKYSWSFVFLGANQDAVLAAAKFNIPQNLAMTYNANAMSVGAVYASAGVATRNLRHAASASRAGFSPDDRRKARQ